MTSHDTKLILTKTRVATESETAAITEVAKNFTLLLVNHATLWSDLTNSLIKLDGTKAKAIAEKMMKTVEGQKMAHGLLALKNQDDWINYGSWGIVFGAGADVEIAGISGEIGLMSSLDLRGEWSFYAAAKAKIGPSEAATRYGGVFFSTESYEHKTAFGFLASAEASLDLGAGFAVLGFIDNFHTGVKILVETGIDTEITLGVGATYEQGI
ncbi:MAG: hypothetical protein F6K21_06845 [Symploca sp. SIO2D2]|nr:hypothetical protein [Symploca sp. SIO2D2]